MFVRPKNKDMTTTPYDILNEAFFKMPNVFTSADFVAVLRKHNFPDELISQGRAAHYLHKVCIKEQGRRVWHKKSPMKESKSYFEPTMPFAQRTPNNPIISDEQKAIDLLKSLSYEIFKRVQL